MNTAVFYESLKVMANGMAGIFAVIIIFYALIVALTKIFPENR